MEKLKNVDLEFIEEEVCPKEMDEDEAKEMQLVEKHLSKINIIKDGKIIKVIEPMLYNAEYISGNKPEDEFATLSISKPEVSADSSHD